MLKKIIKPWSGGLLSIAILLSAVNVSCFAADVDESSNETVDVFVIGNYDFITEPQNTISAHLASAAASTEPQAAVHSIDSLSDLPAGPNTSNNPMINS